MRIASLVALVLAIVTIAIGCGGEEESLTVPMLVGLKEDVATGFATEQGLDIDVQQGRGAAVPAGFVFRQSARAGTLVKKSAKVTIWVASG